MKMNGTYQALFGRGAPRTGASLQTLLLIRDVGMFKIYQRPV